MKLQTPSFDEHNLLHELKHFSPRKLRKDVIRHNTLDEYNKIYADKNL